MRCELDTAAGGEVCPLCNLEEQACTCAVTRGPFQLYDRNGDSAGSFVSVRLALSCLSIIDKFTKARPGDLIRAPVLVDRHDCIVDHARLAVSSAVAGSKCGFGGESHGARQGSAAEGSASPSLSLSHISDKV